MKAQVTHKNLATAFNRITEVRRDVWLMFADSMNERDEATLSAVYDKLGECRTMLETLIEEKRAPSAR